MFLVEKKLLQDWSSGFGWKFFALFLSFKDSFLSMGGITKEIMSYLLHVINVEVYKC